MNRRIVRILSALLLVALCVVVSTRLKLDQDVSRLLPDSDPEFQRAVAALSKVPMLERTIVDIEAPATANASVDLLGRAADRFADALRSKSATVAVQAEISASNILSLVEILRQHAPVLLIPDAWKELKRRIQPSAVEARLVRLAREIQEPDGGYRAEHIAADPLGLRDLVLAPLGELGADLPGSRYVDGRIVTSDRRHILIVVNPGFPPTDTVRDKEFVQAVNDAAAETLQDTTLAGFSVRYLGAHRATIDNAEQITFDAILTGIIGLLLVGAFAVLSFGRAWVAVFAVAPAFFGATVALGVFALTHDTLPALVAGFGAALVGLTDDFAIHVIFRLDRGGTKLPVVEIFVGALTTVAGFLALTASSLPVVRELGVFGSLAVLMAAVFAVFVMPYMVPSQKARPPILDLERRFQQITSLRAARWIAWIALLSTPLLAWGIVRLTFDGDVQHLSRISPAAAQDEAAIQTTWGSAFRVTSVVVEQPTLEAALATNQQVQSTLEELRATGKIRSYTSVSPLLPTVQLQRERLAQWREFWTEGEILALRSAFAVAMKSAPFREDAFEPFFSSLRADVQLLTIRDFDGPASVVLGDRVHSDKTATQILTPTSVEGPENVDEVARAIAKIPGATTLNRGALVRRVAAQISGEMGKLGVLSFMGVAVLVYLWLGTIELTLIVMLPLMLSLVWTLGTLGWCGVPVNMANVMFVPLLFGVAVHYSIFSMSSHLERFRAGQSDASKKHASEVAASVLLCAITTCGGFAALCVASHPVLRTIGFTSALAIFCGAFATLITIPVLSGAVLRLRGPSGTLSLKHLYGSLWVYVWMVGRSFWFLAFERKGPFAQNKRHPAIVTIRRIADVIQRRMPYGRRIYKNAEASCFTQPCVIVANHTSVYDIIALLVLPVNARFFVKSWVFRVPIVNTMARAAGYILTDGVPSDELMERARESLAQGISIIIFPEGTRSRDGKIARFHNGAFALARATGCPVVPVALVNTGIVVRPGTWWVGDHTVVISVLDPMNTKDFEGEFADRRMAQEARSRIQREVERCWIETQSGPGWRLPIANMYRYVDLVARYYVPPKLRHDPLVEALPSICTSDGDLLVAGCGFGVMLARLALAEPKRHICAVDTDSHKLAVARAALGDAFPIEFLETDICNINDRVFDQALLVDVLHYWNPAEQERILRNVAACLRPGGLLLFRDGCTSREGHRMIKITEWLSCKLRFQGMATTQHFRSEEGWRELLESCGFETGGPRRDLGLYSNTAFVCRKR